jgi:riboflavin biosynthesis pyrimidine reductase
MERFHRLLPDCRSGLTAVEIAAETPGGEPPADRPFVLVNMISTADGRATVAGRTAALGNRADYELFHALRARADAVMVGAKTVRIEGYGRMIVDPAVRARREEEGLEGDALAVLVTRSAQLPPDNGLLQAAENRIAVITPSPDAELPESPAEAFYLRGTLEDGVRALRRDHGVRTLLCEGGPALLAQLVGAGMVDELFLALAPLLASGTDPLTILTGVPLDPPVEMELLAVHESGGCLFLRYALRDDGAR